ncbi:hypothetical protein M1L60_01575 [Actinoplanes sp. TRM 88003]|uniref:Uncharacterized protein n=1 Tax=Paractinoplanes aksuensis TaxID=2939490 RepID=A0ABT1DGU1_9ACTN|nr:hypothetical protein [Actinoplanes aksuensis]MCO8269275.1 hypothetical protein [Actinoplanes aksuensis]
MEYGEYGPPAPVTGTRYCRARRRRGVVPASALTVRHTADGLLLTRRASPGAPAARRPSWRGRLALLAVLAGLTATVTLLLTGAYIAPAKATGPCPMRTSTAFYAGGRQLLVRTEPVRSGIALLHLCAQRAVGPVRSWSVVVAGGKGESPAAQRVSASTALAAVPLVPGRRTGVTVVAQPETGPPLTFAAQVSAGAALR